MNPGSSMSNPTANSVKFFVTADLLEQIQNRNWLVRMTTAVNQHWLRKNARKQCRLANGSEGRDPLVAANIEPMSSKRPRARIGVKSSSPPTILRFLIPLWTTT